ncbi:hypothetical protein PAXINDRAFT_8641 [Paxillus involutus ATCC 200175]|nr:hypothetical protein PAXINDRAFT_8641 [Paxillus involutus ATCC 200175]
MQSACKQGWSKDDFGNGPISNSTALANEVTPPDKRLVQAAVRPTSHNNTIAPHTGFLTQALQSASADHCLDIIKALQGPFYHKLVFDNITPEEYNTLSLLVSEDHRYRFSAKPIYHPDLSQLVAMVPYEIHELAMNNFSERVRNLLQLFRLSDDMDVTEIVNDPIVVGGVTWVEIKSIKLHVFLQGDNSNFNFSGNGPLCAQGSASPNMQMDTVNQLLNLATKHLFLKITSMMEEWYNQPPPVNNSNDPPPGGPGGPGPGGLGPGGPGGPGVPGPSRKWPSTPKPSPSRK